MASSRGIVPHGEAQGFQLESADQDAGIIEGECGPTHSGF